MRGISSSALSSRGALVAGPSKAKQLIGKAKPATKLAMKKSAHLIASFPLLGLVFPLFLGPGLVPIIPGGDGARVGRQGHAGPGALPAHRVARERGHAPHGEASASFPGTP